MMKEIYETDYKGTKITIDKKMLYLTGGLLCISGYLLIYGEPFPALTVALLAALPFLHEAGHYLIAREHNLTVSSMSFQKNKIEMVIPDLMTHKDVMDIAIAGELINGAVFLLASGAIYFWGQANHSPFIVLFIIVPAVWIFTWTRPDSDFHVAMVAWQYHQAQQGKDWFGGRIS